MRSSRALHVLMAAFLPLACTDSSVDPVQPPLDTEVAAAPTGPTVVGTVGRVTGGGHVRNGPWRVSFAGVVEAAEGREAETGRTTVVAHFHEVSIPAVSGRTFKARRVIAINFVLPDDPRRCHAAVFANMEGTLDGEPGWVMVYRANDGGPGKDRVDTVRLSLFDPGGTEAYDMTGNPGADFPRESVCVGLGRANLTGGNLTIHVPREGIDVN
ncbi:MAG: hypothetical protein HKO98_06490 [Gemmatimonadetes bacterium]|nr:hypothetical protein [Gemmatimonadota bacterium]